MKYLEYIYAKIYYRIFSNNILFKKAMLPSSMETKKNLFIYFDYEREFGGYDTSLTDYDIFSILDLLDDFNIKSTWFTVGKIFEHYPDTIHEIIKRGHEIASHTYHHLPPLTSSFKKISKDFSKFHKVASSRKKVYGYHSPCGLWSLASLRMIIRYGYQYEVISLKKRKKPTVSIIRFIKKKLYRFNTLGDDWGLFNSNFSEKEALDYLINIYNQLSTGEVAGMGFHPWVLFSDENYFRGFREFLKIISQDKNTNIQMAQNYSKLLRDKL